MSSDNRTVVESVAPEDVWRLFAELSEIPRCSRQEDRVREWILSIAEERGLSSKTDSVGNILVSKRGTGALEDKPPLAIQAHIDMVCEKNSGTIHDFERDPIRLRRESDWIAADKTTLGADNGIAVAMMLALLTGAYEHPPLECLFTIDEESGLTGATKLDANLLTAKRLINIDTEEEGHFCIGCAGGRNSYAYLPVSFDRATGEAYRLTVTGLKGGHSGINIGEGRGCSLELAARVLYGLHREFPSLRIVDLQGGDKHNAIPREFEATLLAPAGAEGVTEAVERWHEQLLGELGDIEEKLTVAVEPVETEVGEAMSEESTAALIRMMAAMPHGVLSISRAVPGLVETSTNFAAIRVHQGEVKVLTSQRSNLASGVDDAVRRVRAVVELAGGRVEEAEGYPAWTPEPDSDLLRRAVEVYRRSTGGDPVVEAVHAGLECGVIGDKYPGMEMISFGPDIEGAHTPEERVRVSSVERVWQFLLLLLREL
ncbi:MAG: aminoacyl-histidine dipeptidase [Spirochaetaceae bacterium]